MVDVSVVVDQKLDDFKSINATPIPPYGIYKWCLVKLRFETIIGLPIYFPWPISVGSILKETLHYAYNRLALADAYGVYGFFQSRH